MKKIPEDRLLELIAQEGFATVKALAAATYMSESTVRRRLTALETAGLVRRSYGGAQLIGGTRNTPIAFRLQKNHKEKDTIARKAAARVRDDSTVFIDASSTCLHMVPHLSDKKGLTVYTYSTTLCEMLAEYGVRTVCVGGEFDPVSKVCTGAVALETLRLVWYDACFFSSSSFCGGKIYDYCEAESFLRRAALAQATRRFFLCDSEKFGKQSAFFIADAKNLDEVITTTDPAADT